MLVIGREVGFLDQTKILEIKCTNCNNWFPSPIFFGDINSFDSSIMEGNRAQCPHCDKMTDCNKENMRVVSENGGFRGSSTY
jgi:DNA-directed RNA polymerase subunit RPC12/RpoP